MKLGCLLISVYPSVGSGSLRNVTESLRCCERIVVDLQRGCVDAAIDHDDAPNDVWAFGVVRREVVLGPGAWAYFDGFGCLRRLRVRFDAASGWIDRLRDDGAVHEHELVLAEQVDRLALAIDPQFVPAPVTDQPVENSLDGRVAVVTGASRGIGASVAQRLGAAGATVVVVARTSVLAEGRDRTRQKWALDDTARVIEQHGGHAWALPADLSDPTEADRIVDDVIERFGRLDIVVNNAARGVYLRAERWTPRDLVKVFQVNAMSPFLLARAALPAMRQQHFGAIVNVSSIVAQPPIGPPYGLFERASYTTVYAMAKAALDRMSTGLAIEGWPDGIVINSLAPSGGVRTPGALAASDMLAAYPQFAETQETMAEAVLALCEPRPAPITGQVLTSGALLADLGREVRALDGGPLLNRPEVAVDLRDGVASAAPAGVVHR